MGSMHVVETNFDKRCSESGKVPLLNDVTKQHIKTHISNSFKG